MRLDQVQIGDRFTGFYIMKNVIPKTTNSGKPFLSLLLTDATSSIDAKVWDYAGPIGMADEGQIALVQGLLQEYRGALQIKIEKIRLAEPTDEYDLMELVPSAPIDLDNAYARVETLVQSMTDKDYQAVCLAFLHRHADRFRQLPAAKSVHHSFLGGLLMHTSYMMCMADYMSRLYGAVIQRDLLVAGTLLHDMAKLEEFVTTHTGLVSEYSLKGQLLGHLVMGAQETAEICKELQVPEEKSLLLQHMLLSHHGVPEFGAAVVPQFAEAELLYYLDSIDSRMEIYRENLEKTPVGSFTPRIFALDKKIYHHE